ncbi:MAG: redox-regulated ATPase YchF, partial [Burkholderiales bacterium]
MSLKCGIVGLPNVGKSTLFNALTKAQIAAENYPFCTIEPNVGIVEVPDPRLARIAAVAKPQKVIPAVVEFVDIAGLVAGASKGEGLGNKFLANIRETDAIAHVVRCFEDDNIVHVDNRIDPLADVATIDTELCLKDLESVEKRRERTQKQTKAAGKAGEEARAELEILDRVAAGLDQGIAVRAQKLSPEDRAAMRELFLLTAKPVLFVANIAEAQIGKDDDPLVAQVRALADREG